MAYVTAPKTKCTGLPGQQYRHPRRQVKNISDIKKGDHVMFQGLLHEHHGIVIDADEQSGAFNAIKFDKESRKDGIKIQKNYHILSKEKAGSVYVVQYKEGECLPADEVVENAKEMLNKKDYNPAWNNCECMALECKIGKEKAKPGQIRNLISFVLLEAVESGKGKLLEQALLISAKKGLEWLYSYIERFSGTNWLSVATAIEAGILAYKVKVHKFVWHYIRGQITEKRCIAMIIRECVGLAVESVCAYGGCGIGAIVGSAYWGGFLGRVVGWTVKWLCNHYVWAGMSEKLDGDLDSEEKVKGKHTINEEKESKEEMVDTEQTVGEEENDVCGEVEALLYQQRQLKGQLPIFDARCLLAG